MGDAGGGSSHKANILELLIMLIDVVLKYFVYLFYTYVEVTWFEGKISWFLENNPKPWVLTKYGVYRDMVYGLTKESAIQVYALKTMHRTVNQPQLSAVAKTLRKFHNFDIKIQKCNLSLQLT